MKRIELKSTSWVWLLFSAALACTGGAADELTTVPSDAAGSGGGAAGANAYASSAQWCDVKRTLDARCVACHDGQGTANTPMPLLSYAHTQAAAFSDPSLKVYELMRARVHDTVKPMPPQQPLSAAELSAIDKWVAAGAPAGDDPSCGDAAPMAPLPEDWAEKCDATYTILSHADGGDTEPYRVPAGQELQRNLTVRAPWGNEAVQGIAVRPVTDNRKILHHWILYGPGHEFLVGWAPGNDTAPLPPDVGMNLAGGKLTLNMHYNNVLGSEAELDRSGLEICVLKAGNFRKHTAAVHTGFAKFPFSIPARATDYEVTGRCTVTASTPVTLINTSPHAHKLARHMKFSVLKASGERIVLFDGKFNFEEQQSYPLDPPVQLTTGDTVITTCIYDNATDKKVTFGENTGDEMCFNFASYYPMGALECGFAF